MLHARDGFPTILKNEYSNAAWKLNLIKKKVIQQLNNKIHLYMI